MRGITWLFLAIAVMTARADAQAPAAERRVALVIGNSAYQHMGRLANPRNDATAMARQLVELGFEVVGNGPRLDLDQAGMNQAIRDFGRSLRGGAVGLFYYAGHGVQVRNRNFLVPVNARVEAESEISLVAVDANLALEQLEASGARLSIVILDACRNNPFPGGQFRSVGSGLAQMQAAAGTVISFAAQPGAMALDGAADGNSPYTAALLEAMRRPGLNVLDVFNEVGVSVSRATGRSQQPWVSSSPIEGRFYFTPSVETAALPPGGQATDPAAVEIAYWNAIQGARSIAALREYLRQYPQGRFAGLARVQVADLERTVQANQPAARPIQVAPAVPPRPAQPAAPPAAVAQAPAVAGRVLNFSGSAPPTAGEGCSGLDGINIRIVDGVISGSAHLATSRGQNFSWSITGTMTPDGRVTIRVSSNNAARTDDRASMMFTGRVDGNILTASQPGGRCGRSLRLTQR